MQLKLNTPRAPSNDKRSMNFMENSVSTALICLNDFIIVTKIIHAFN